MSDVAKKANVSLSTVSYAISGTRPISEETRQRIFRAMEELDYTPHPLARGLASKHSRVLAILFPTIERGLGITELEFVSNAADAASKNGYHLVLWSAETNDPEELHQLIKQGLVDGVILMEIHKNDKRVNLLKKLKFPFSMIGRCSDNDGEYADIDFVKTIEEILDYLTNLGHKNLIYVNQSKGSFTAGYGPVVRTSQAFEEYVNSIGINGHMYFCHPSPQCGYEIFNSIMEKHPDTTAIVSMNERAIPGIIQAAADRGWHIPEDLSLAAIVSSVKMAEMMVPRLTTMEPPSAELGRIAAELLIKHLEEKSDETPRILFPCRLVVGESTGPSRLIINDKK